MLAVLIAILAISAPFSPFAQEVELPPATEGSETPPVADIEPLPAPLLEELPPGESDADPLTPPAAPLPPDRSVVVSPPEPPAPLPEINAIRLQGLNKVTARVSTLEGPLGTSLRFGNLEIIARRCWKAPPEERPENAALLEIRELKSDEAPQTVFTGWMFSSSPGLSALEHPVYDVTVISCEHREGME